MAMAMADNEFVEGEGEGEGEREGRRAARLKNERACAGNNINTVMADGRVGKVR